MLMQAYSNTVTHSLTYFVDPANIHFVKLFYYAEQDDYNTSAEPDDYRTSACNSTARLDRNDTIQVVIDFRGDDGVALEGTEELLMKLQLSQEQESTFTAEGNIFIQSTSVIHIHDITSNQTACKVCFLCYI